MSALRPASTEALQNIFSHRASILFKIITAHRTMPHTQQKCLQSRSPTPEHETRNTPTRVPLHHLSARHISPISPPLLSLRYTAIYRSMIRQGIASTLIGLVAIFAPTAVSRADAPAEPPDFKEV